MTSESVNALLLDNPPASGLYNGMSYSQASRVAQAICKLAGETGQTMNAALHLKVLRDVMLNHLANSGKIYRIPVIDAA